MIEPDKRFLQAEQVEVQVRKAVEAHTLALKKVMLTPRPVHQQHVLH